MGMKRGNLLEYEGADHGLGYRLLSHSIIWAELSSDLC